MNFTALRIALTLERVAPDSLEAAGVRRWDAIDLIRRLAEGGDLRDGAWVAEARQRWQATVPTDDSAPASKALDRLASGDRPREKAWAGGIDSCDDADLLALLLRTGGADGVLELAQRLLNEHGGVSGLARLTLEQLADTAGIGPAKAAELAAAFELGRRVAASPLRERPDVGTPERAAGLVAPLMSGLIHEELWVMCVDPRQRLIGQPRQVSRGDIDGTDAGPRALLRIALVAGASGCIAVHNHPSGDPTPSAADITVTKRLATAARTVDIALHDHLVIGAGGAFTSLRRSRPDAFS